MKNKYFFKHEDILICPICNNKLNIFQEKSLVCKEGHAFDIAKSGYVNFMQKAKDFYNQDLFLSRRNIFEKKFYDKVVLEVENIVSKYANSGLLLDVGCGEGFYLKSILNTSNWDKIGLDISKDAIKLATKGVESGLWLVADLENIPLADNCVDIILNILTPANYKEFKRVLKQDGYIIKIIPGNEYLIQLRKLGKTFLKNETHENSKVIEHFENNVRLLEKKKVSYSLSINENEAFDFANMTPMLSKVNTKKLDFSKLSDISIDLEILVGR